MSLRDLPRLPFSTGTALPTPMGFISSCELLETLLAVWWRHDLTQLAIELNGHRVEAERKLGNVAASGQISECTSLIRKAGIEGDLVAFVPIDPQSPDPAKMLRIGRADWATSGLPDWENDLMTGAVFRFADAPTAWADGKQLCYREDQAEDWLRGLRSPHVIPDPIRADASRLPERPYVFLSECVSWLANAPIRDAVETFAWEVNFYSRATSYADGGRPELPPEWSADDEYCSFDRWFATGLAELMRRRRAASILRDALSAGEISCRGRMQRLEDASDVQLVPSEVFQLTVSLKPVIDGIGMDMAVPFESQDGDAFLNGANWKGIRFLREHLVQLWGTDFGRSVVSPASNFSARSLNKDETKRRYRRRVEGWPTDEAPPTRPMDERWCKENLGITRERARELRRTIAPPEWQAPGRRRKTGRN